MSALSQLGVGLLGLITLACTVERVPTPTATPMASASNATPTATIPAKSVAPPSQTSVTPPSAEALFVAPIRGRWGALAAWTGSELIVTGGSRGEATPTLLDGAAYDPASGSWRMLARQPRRGSSGWLGGWGPGRLLTLWYLPSSAGMGPHIHAVAAYDPAAGRWTLHSREEESWFSGEAAVWTGTELLVFGHDGKQQADAVVGMAYNPDLDSWRDIGGISPPGRGGYSVVWTGSEALLWGGISSGSGELMADGWAYAPATDSWRNVPAGPLIGRYGHAAVWAGGEMIVYGGTTTTDGSREFGDGSILGDGAAYSPTNDTWRELTPPPLAPRIPDVAVLAGGKAIFWGGTTCPAPQGDYPFCRLGPADDGAVYDPATDRWQPMTPSPLAARSQPSAAVAGDRLIIWGGQGHSPDGVVGFADGAIYDPISNTWSGAP